MGKHMSQTSPGVWTRKKSGDLDDTFPKEDRYDVMKGTIVGDGKSTAATVSNGSKCTHDTITAVWKIGEGVVYAGSVSNFRDDLALYKIDVLFNLCGSKIDNGLKLNEAARKLFPMGEYPSMFTETPPMVEVDWPDMGVPKVGFGFFSDVVKFVATGKNIGVYCAGGHGRTGTFLAAVGHIAGVKGDVLGKIRGQYCLKAVETTSQIEYLKKLGVDTKCPPSSPITTFHYADGSKKSDFDFTGSKWLGHGRL